MTDQLIIEPEARLLVELGQERGVVYEDELAGLSLELDLDADDVQTLRDELAQLGVDIVEPPAPEERIEVVEVEIATTNSLDLFLRQAGRYPLLTKDEEVMLAKRIEAGDPRRQAAHDRVQPAAGRLDRQAVPRPGRAVPGSDPGGRAGARTAPSRSSTGAATSSSRPTRRGGSARPCSGRSPTAAARSACPFTSPTACGRSSARAGRSRPASGREPTEDEIARAAELTVRTPLPRRSASPARPCRCTSRSARTATPSSAT